MRSGIACLSTALFWVGCTGSPHEALTYTEVWELLAVTGDGGVVDARVEVGNRGVLRGQGHVSIDHWPLQGDPVQYSRWSAPIATHRSADGRQVTLDTDVLGATGDLVEVWHLRARSDDANAVLQVSSRTPAIPAAAEQVVGGQWSVAAPVASGTMQGWLEAGERGGRLSGQGVVLHRGGDGLAGFERRTVAVVGEGVSIGVDEHGPVRVAWARVNGQTLDVSNARITLFAGEVGIDLRPGADVVVAVTPTGAGGRTASSADLTAPERIGVDTLLSPPDRRVLGARAQVTYAGATLDHAALVVWEDRRSIDIPVRRASSPARRRR